MFHRKANDRTGGFTLIELAIVLGIMGILAAGLWRLMSASNQQSKDTATAQQQQALINAVKGYMADMGTTGGQAWITGKGPNSINNLPLPTSNTSLVNCQASIGATFADFCNYLPPGFYNQTTNPYGQTYMIQVLKDASAINTPPQNYSFMIVTSGGSVIPDPDGGRISALIGGDGGFIYTAPVCTATSSSTVACGTMGAWNVNVQTGYGFTAAEEGFGSVASLSFVSSATSSNYDWLARVPMPSDPNFSYNTMSTPLYLGNIPSYFGTNSAGVPVPATAAAVMNVQGGEILLGATGSIVGSTGGTTAGVGNGGSTIALNGNVTLSAPGAPQVPNPMLTVTDACIGPNTGPPQTFDNCGLAAQFYGNVAVTGLLNSNVFIYTGSDRRLKKDIKPLPNSLPDIMKLKPVSFVYKSGGKNSLGVIAQELEKIYPQMVVTGPSGMKEVAYDELIAPMISAIQELKKENDGLRDQLRVQAARQDRLEQEIQKLGHK